MAKVKWTLEKLKALSRAETNALAKQLGIKMKPGKVDLGELQQKILAVSGAPKEPDPPATPPPAKKGAQRAGKGGQTADPEPALTDPVAPPPRDVEELMPPWATALVRKFDLLAGKVDKLLAAIEVEGEETAADRPPPKTRDDVPAGGAAVAPKKDLPLPKEATLEEQGFVSVTSEEIEQMDEESLRTLAKDIGVDISTLGTNVRRIRKTLLNAVQELGQLAETEQAQEAVAPKKREKAPDADNPLVAMQRDYKKKNAFNQACGIACTACPFGKQCYEQFYVTKLYVAAEAVWDEIGIPQAPSIKALWEGDAKSHKMEKAIAAHFAQ